MFNKEIKSFIELQNAFPTEEDCIKHLENVRWGLRVVSPFDEKSKVYKSKKNPHTFLCKNTNKYFNVKTGTFFENTKLPLMYWFWAICAENNDIKGTTSTKLAKALGIRQATAWGMLHKIRTAFAPDDSPMTGIIEADEAWFGGKNKNRHEDKKVAKTDGVSYPDKVLVLGLVDREGKLRCDVIPDRSEETIRPLIYRNVVKDSVLITDGWTAYARMHERFDHHYVKDGKRAQGDAYNREIHTNNIEGAWATMKRGYTGVYNWWSRKHFNRYLQEFVFKYNTRHMRFGERFNYILSRMETRLTYKMLIHG